VFKFYLLLLVCLTPLFSQDKPFEVVRFSAEKEAWLNKNIDKAIELLLPQAKASTANAVTFYNLGYMYYLRGKTGEALNYLQKSIEKDANYPYPYLVTARIYRKSGNLLGALTQLRRGLATNSKNYDLLLEAGSIYFALKKIEEAEQIFLQLINSAEEKAAPRIGLAKIYRGRQEFNRALEILGREKDIYPESELLLEKAHIQNAAAKENAARDIYVRLYQEYPYAPEMQIYRDTLRIRFGIEDINPKPVLKKYRYKIQPDESLDYTVKYGFITLGWLNIRMLPAKIIDGRTVYPIQFFVNSNPSFDFMLSLHHIYESYIDAETMNAIQTRLYTPGNEKYIVRNYFFEYKNSRFIAHTICSDNRFERVEKLLPQMAQDGTSMLYFARGLVSNQMNGTTTVVIDEEYKYGHITYLNEREEVDVGDREINAIKIFARAEFEGIAGMNGDAWGWFSPDDQAVPLMGKIKIILGSISVEMDENK